MTDQNNAAAERSAHVERGPAKRIPGESFLVEVAPGVFQIKAVAEALRERDEARAALLEARREGIEAAALVASRRAASRHSTVAHCHSDRSKKHMQIRADEAGQLVADIRTLLEDGR